MKKQFFLSVAFLVVVLVLGIAAKLTAQSLYAGQGLDALACGDFIWGLSTLITYKVFFTIFAPQALPKIGADRESMFCFIGGFFVSATTVVVAFLLLLLVGGTARFFISPEACFVSLMAAVGIAMLEEVLFRGILFNLSAQVLPAGVTVFVVAIIFTLTHLDGRSDLSLASTLLFSLTFTISFAQYKNLWLPIGLHAGSNFLTILASGIHGVHGGFVNFTSSQFKIEFTFLIASTILFISVCIFWLVLWIRRSEDNLASPRSQA